MSSPSMQCQHPIVACARMVRGALKDVADVQPVFMSAEDKAAAMIELAAAQHQVAELQGRVMANAADVAQAHGAHDVATWLAHAVQAEPRATRADLELARELDRSCPLVAAGMREGRVSAAQARVITAALADLPADVGPDTRARAEETLVGYADRFRPTELRRLGRRILDVVAPEVAEAEEAKQLEEQERRAREKASLRFRPLGDGTTRITGLLPDPIAARLKRYLESFTSPRQREAGERAAGAGPVRSETQEPDSGTDDTADETPFRTGPTPTSRKPQHRAYAEAFAALLERLDPSKLPDHGGDATTVLVTIDHPALTRQLATAGLLDAEDGTISASEARRLACTAKILPVVLGGESEPLDLGRARRLFSPAQRKALRLRDRGCRAEGCTVPATWTEAHHLQPWSHGGPTDLTNAISLCNFHHHRIHDQTYHHDQLPDGTIRFHRRV